jgi:NTE family protein
MTKLGLVLTGGGARAAYQVGVLSAVSEIVPEGRCVFSIISGISAGAINGAVLAAAHHDFRGAVGKLRCVWQHLRPDMVYRASTGPLLWGGVKLVRELAMGGRATRQPTTHLLDTEPLYDLIAREVDFDAIAAHVRSGALHGVSITATNYGSGSTVTFYDGEPSIRPWVHRAACDGFGSNSFVLSARTLGEQLFW